MEFPNLGQQCALTTCNQLDFLPMKCDACGKIFCKDHVKYTEHSCDQAYKKDNQVPVCPLCNQPVPVPRGQQPDIKVGEHIDRECQSDPAVKKRHAFANKCSVKGCKQKELIKVRCDSCRQNFCLKHRHEQDHNCTAVVKPDSSSTGQKSSASIKAGQAAAARFQSKPSGSGTKPQQTALTSYGRDLDRERRERQASQQRPAHQLQQSSMTEDEALALAIQASLSGQEPAQSQAKPNKQLTAQEKEDLALAQALAQSEKDELERQRRGHQGSSEKKSDCKLS